MTSTGVIYLADRGNGLVRRIDADGLISSVEIDSSWSLHHPTGVAVDDAGGLYVSASEAAQILYRNPTGRWTRVVADDQLRDPRDLAMDRQGQLLVADTGRRIVARVVDGEVLPCLLHPA